MKALIPAAGLGTRLRPLTFTRPKPVLQVAGKPIVHHAITSLKAAGIHEIGIIVSELTRVALQHALRDMQDVSLHWIEQKEQLGLGHAILCAKEWIGNDHFCVYLGDNLFEEGAKPFIDRFQQDPTDALIALVEVPDPSAFGVAQMESGRITRLVEKPKVPPSRLAVAGLYCFTPVIFQELEQLQPSARGEYEITDGIQALIERGGLVNGALVQGWWKDTGRPEDLLEANHLLLEQMPHELAGEIIDSRVHGRLHLPASSRIINSKIVGPVFLDEDVTIENAYIGPFTSIGAGTIIRHAEVEHSVIDAQVIIEHLETRLQDCLIGVRAHVRGGRSLPRTHKLTVSDASIVELI